MRRLFARVPGGSSAAPPVFLSVGAGRGRIAPAPASPPRRRTSVRCTRARRGGRLRTPPAEAEADGFARHPQRPRRTASHATRRGRGGRPPAATLSDKSQRAGVISGGPLYSDRGGPSARAGRTGSSRQLPGMPALPIRGRRPAPRVLRRRSIVPRSDRLTQNRHPRVRRPRRRVGPSREGPAKGRQFVSGFLASFWSFCAAVPPPRAARMARPGARSRSR